MCGITGYVGDSETSRRDLLEAVRTLTHRGPDGEGCWFADGVGLGHRRLAILDLSARGRQPMLSATGRYAFVYNGEVYNYPELRRELTGLGCRFASNGDTEVILAALETWGVEAALKRMIGMFAMALWDTGERRLLLIRDRLGVKPLYYGWDGKVLCFASELKAVRAYRHWQPQIDRTALTEYFQFGYIDAPRSIYQNVYKLPPGHWLELRPGCKPSLRRYWSVLEKLETPHTSREDELAEQLEALMVDAFRLRLAADVPVGVFLSGGLDSTLVAALLQKHCGNIQTFTIGFGETRHNEAAHARKIADFLGTDHHEHVLEGSEAHAALADWGKLYDEPFADSSGIPTYRVAQFASERVKVVLSADGGDELFSGYGIYDWMARIERQRTAIPAVARRLGGWALHRLPLSRFDEWLTLAETLPKPARDWARRHSTRLLSQLRDGLCGGGPGALYENALKNAWWGDRAAILTGVCPGVSERCDVYPGDFVEQMCLWDLHHYLPGDILAKVDRATMAASIEGREPLLDQRLVEFAFRLPLMLRRGSLGSKHLLRRVLYRHVPRELVDRPKQGFGIPLAEWLRKDWAQTLDEHTDALDIKVQGILEPTLVARTLRAFRQGDAYSANQAWSLLAFQLWRRQWMQ